MCLQILELLWNLAHLPQSSKVMMELALDAHASILMDSSLTNEAEKRNYIEKCVKDIRKVSMHGLLGEMCMSWLHLSDLYRGPQVA